MRSERTALVGCYTSKWGGTTLRRNVRLAEPNLSWRTHCQGPAEAPQNDCRRVQPDECVCRAKVRRAIPGHRRVTTSRLSVRATASQKSPKRSLCGDRGSPPSNACHHGTPSIPLHWWRSRQYPPSSGSHDVLCVDRQNIKQARRLRYLSATIAQDPHNDAVERAAPTDDDGRSHTHAHLRVPPRTAYVWRLRPSQEWQDHE